MTEELVRCWGDNDLLMTAYHDDEWGYPVHDDQKLFEHLMLDCFQAGLSWRTILHKREGFLRAFDNFDPNLVARYTDADRLRLLADEGIVRNRLKINAAISNAQALLKIVEEFGSFDQYIWGFTDHKTLFRQPMKTLEEMRPTSPESQAMSKDLKARGFKFVGPTVCYAFMQTVGMVDDHLEGCFRYQPR
jgi:DNA-3-methyladenine glycosylase I